MYKFYKMLVRFDVIFIITIVLNDLRLPCLYHVIF